MNRKKRILLIVVCLAVLIIVGTAIVFSLNSRSEPNDPAGSRTPLGGLLHRAQAVSDLKQQMGDLRDFYPAMMQFAQAHQDELPKTIGDLRPYLPQKLAYLDDDHWEMLSIGKMSPLINGKDANNAILLQQKNLLPETPKIIMYADGHIEYKK